MTEELNLPSSISDLNEVSFLKSNSGSEKLVQTESVKKAAPTADKVTEKELSKQTSKIIGREKWQKGKSHKKSTRDEKEIEFLNCQTQLGKNMLDKGRRCNEQRC